MKTFQGINSFVGKGSFVGINFQTLHFHMSSDFLKSICLRKKQPEENWTIVTYCYYVANKINTHLINVYHGPRSQYCIC